MIAACHLGPPPASVGPWRVGVVTVAAPEPALQTDLASSLAIALAGVGALGEAGAIRVDLQLRRWEDQVIASGSGQRVHRIDAELLVVALGPQPRELVLRSSRSYVEGEGDSLGAAAARASAARELAAALGQEAAAWLQLSQEVRQ